MELIYIELTGFAVIILTVVVTFWACKKIEHKYSDAHKEVGKYWP